MLVLLQYIIRLVNQVPWIRRARPFTLQCSLSIFVLVYVFVGGLIFNKLEANALKSFRNEQTDKANLCVIQVLRRMKNYTEEAVKHIEGCWKAEVDERTEWNYVTSTLYGFGIVTTLGYNRIAPITLTGRMFCILYGLCGIPVTMITIANVGRYLNSFAKSCKQKLENFRAQHWNRKRKLKMGNRQDEEEDEEASTGFASLILLTAFLLYVAFGALLLPLLNGETDFINGLYYNFLCLTAIDFGQLVPQRVAFLPITFMYVCVGLAITTIAIEVGSEYVRKLHYIGKKMKNVAATKIWFGGKTMKVRDLLHEVGSKCGVEASIIDNIDLDNVIEQVIARNEGKPPPAYVNEDVLSPRETTAELLSPEPESTGQPPEMEPCFAAEESLSSISLSEIQQLDTIYDKEVAIIQIVEDEPVAETVNFVQTEVMALTQQVIESAMYQAVTTVADLVDEDVSSDAPSTSTRSISPTEPRIPRNFWEKKEMYGRDALKLFETYQEEWERIAHLSDRRLRAQLPRRKSILHVSPHRLYPSERLSSAERTSVRSTTPVSNGVHRELSRERSVKPRKRGSLS